MISKQFMSDHPQRGELTYFKHKILLKDASEATVKSVEKYYDWYPKIHTIRTNYAYWARVAEEVNSGRGVLSLRQWSGSPYNFKRDGSKPVEFLRLEKMGVQRVSIEIQKSDMAQYGMSGKLYPTILTIKLPEVKKYGSIPIAANIQVPDDHIEFARLICKNDGLNDYDFKYWFKKDVDDGVIIHFTDFRYS